MRGFFSCSPEWFLLLLVVCIPSSGFAGPVLVVAFGDSVVAPRAETRVYPEILGEELSNVKIVNAGVPGNTTTAALKRLDKDVRDRKPQLVTIQFGINDAAVDVWKSPPAAGPRVPLDSYRANLREMISKLRADGTRVVLLTPTPLVWTPKLIELYGKPPYDPASPEGFDRLLVPYREVVKEIGSAENVPVLDTALGMREEAVRLGTGVERFLSDGMHPNDFGHRILADVVRDGLLKIAASEHFEILPGEIWHRSGSNVRIHPAAADASHDSPNPTVLGCSLARLEDGRLLTAYSTPGTAYGKHGSNWIALRGTTDGGRTWSKEEVIARHPDCQPAHPSLLRARDGTLHVFYLGFKKWGWKDKNPTPDTVSDLWTVRSTDKGATWSPPQRIFEGYTGATNGALETRSGALMVPFSHYVLNPGRLVSRVVFSKDKGATWAAGPALDIGGEGDHGGALEPALIERKDGSVRMYIRTTLGAFYECDSTDGGETWNRPAAGKLEATSAPANLCRLADDSIAIAWNPKTKGRRSLHVAFSRDEGESWSAPTMVAHGLSPTYPFVLESQPGELWVGYHDIEKDWNTPRARFLRLPISSLLRGR
jgi:lysophospholipase L1-like esterase/predicted neuraminidase